MAYRPERWACAHTAAGCSPWNLSRDFPWSHQTVLVPGRTAVQAGFGQFPQTTGTSSAADSVLVLRYLSCIRRKSFHGTLSGVLEAPPLGFRTTPIPGSLHAASAICDEPLAIVVDRRGMVPLMSLCVASTVSTVNIPHSCSKDLFEAKTPGQLYSGKC
ncbi:hypothetical protein LZ30DRAFT_690569 [Colletotrichum cereale]|nr:hypothetical protein LZ30DRAFT_690569 [Colletotrichum cereale]